jgi:hypothetical protein
MFGNNHRQGTLSYVPGTNTPVVMASEGRLAEGPSAGCFIRPATTGSFTPTVN